MMARAAQRDPLAAVPHVAPGVEAKQDRAGRFQVRRELPDRPGWREWLARHFGLTPDAARVQLDRMKLLPATMTSLPSGRTLAYRYGWGPAFDSEQAEANQPRVPRRLLDRAVGAYRAGLLGVSVLARLQGRSVADVELALADTGIVIQPVVRRANIDALVARAAASNAT